jgi:predicted enzyme related to lactoylglutathione lyase
MSPGLLTRIILRTPSSHFFPVTNFYHKTFSLPIVNATEVTANIQASENVTLTVTTEDYTQTEGDGGEGEDGFLLQFDVKDIQASLMIAMENGGEMDGPIKHPAHGKVVVVKDPTGRKVGIWEKVGGFGDVTG